MTIRDWQRHVQKNAPATLSGTEIVLAVTEEIGEVAQEVALIERIGSKAAWEKPAVQSVWETRSHTP